MRFQNSHHAWRHYFTLALIASTGALFALFCAILMLAEAFFRLFIIIALFIFGVGAVVAGHLKQKTRLN